MNTNGNLSMKYHIFYTVVNFVFSIIVTFAIFVSVFETPSALVALPLPVYILSMSILLYKKKKAGDVMRQIFNIFDIITSAIELPIGIFCTFVGLACSSILNDLGTPSNGFGAFVSIFTAIGSYGLLAIGIATIFVAIATIILNVLTIKYYKKRKYWFA